MQSKPLNLKNKKQIWNAVQKGGVKVLYNVVREDFNAGILPGTAPEKRNVQRYIDYMRRKLAGIKTARSTQFTANGIQRLARSNKIALSLYAINNYIAKMPKQSVKEVIINGRPCSVISTNDASKCINWLKENKRPYRYSGKYVGKLKYVGKSGKGSWRAPRAEKEPREIRELVKALNNANEAVTNLKNKDEHSPAWIDAQDRARKAALALSEARFRHEQDKRGKWERIPSNPTT